MIKITHIDVLENHHIHIIFNDGIEKIINFGPFISDDAMTSPLRDPAYFRQVKIYENGRGIYWPNGYDVCPDNLRFHLEAAKIVDNQSLEAV